MTRTGRLLDLALAIPALILALPLIAVGALLIRLSMGRPVLFWQQRVGYRGRVFLLCKLRTMAASPGTQPRIPRVGGFLRRASIDELPQLWNVIRGEMSIVGPRPLLPHYLPLYSPRQARRHEVRPGLTGWAQIHGRNLLDWERKLELDVWYVEHKDLMLDLKILALTVPVVLRAQGVHPSGELLMPEFTGSKCEAKG